MNNPNRETKLHALQCNRLWHAKQSIQRQNAQAQLMESENILKFKADGSDVFLKRWRSNLFLGRLNECFALWSMNFEQFQRQLKISVCSQEIAIQSFHCRGDREKDNWAQGDHEVRMVHEWLWGKEKKLPLKMLSWAKSPGFKVESGSHLFMLSQFALCVLGRTTI